jgi:hypothetical protein
VIVETAVEQEVLQELEEVFGAEVLEGVGKVFGILDVLHGA